VLDTDAAAVIGLCCLLNFWFDVKKSVQPVKINVVAEYFLVNI